MQFIAIRRRIENGTYCWRENNSQVSFLIILGALPEYKVAKARENQTHNLHATALN